MTIAARLLRLPLLLLLLALVLLSGARAGAAPTDRSTAVGLTRANGTGFGPSPTATPPGVVSDGSIRVPNHVITRMDAVTRMNDILPLGTPIVIG